MRLTPRALVVPTPRALYVHDDLSGGGPTGDPVAARLAAELLALVRRGGAHVRVLTLEEQLAGLLAGAAHAPFAVTVGIGPAGERVARQVHERAGWFPVVRRIDLAREEDGDGYRLVSTTARPWPAQLRGLDDCPSLAVVDDTVFSGLTMRTVLCALPPALRARTRAFCLRAAADTLPSVAALCPVAAGFAAPGRLVDEVSFINASGLVRRGAIRRAGRPALAFFERPEWIHAWFPDNGAEVLAACRRLAARLDAGLRGTPCRTPP